jgi:hypothetical protein
MNGCHAIAALETAALIAEKVVEKIVESGVETGRVTARSLNPDTPAAARLPAHEQRRRSERPSPPADPSQNAKASGLALDREQSCCAQTMTAFTGQPCIWPDSRTRFFPI